MVIVTLLILASTCCANNVTVDCCAVWQAFVNHIQSATDTNPTSCDAETVCSSSRVMTLVHTSNAFHPNIMTVQNNKVKIALNPGDLTDLLVLSMLGRLVTKQDKAIAEESYAHYVYNELHNRLQPVYSNCTFEKEMYVTLLCVTVIVLVVLLVSQLDTNETSTPEPAPTATLSNTQQMSFKIPLSTSSMRYRPVSTH
tara:strand:+ start:31451 stop:32044 length:594 start_codon:yes stop_codon:yes gene_type:complete